MPYLCFPLANIRNRIIWLHQTERQKYFSIDIANGWIYCHLHVATKLPDHAGTPVLPASSTSRRYRSNHERFQMNEPDRKQIEREKEAQNFVLKFAALQLFVPILATFVFPDHMRAFHEDTNLGMLLLYSAVWNLMGVCFYLFFNSNKIAKEVERILVLMVFFAPTTSLLLFGPVLSGANVEFKDPFVGMRDHFSQEAPEPSFNSRPIILARGPIAKGSFLTEKNIIVQSYGSNKFKDAIVATKENYFDNKRGARSVLGKRALVNIEGGDPIHYADIDPSYQ